MKNNILLDEILQQPDTIQQLISQEIKPISLISQKVKNRFQYIVIAARGTSDNAARYAQYLFGAHNGIQVALATPSLFTIYKKPPSMKGALIIGISQSGQSPDIVSVLEEARKQGCPTISITNRPKSPLANISDFCIPLHTNNEKATAATKTYTASLCALALLSVMLSNNASCLRDIESLPHTIYSTLCESFSKMDLVQRYRYIEHTAVIGRGFNYSTAFEIALKIKELTKVISEPYSSADFLHGPIAMIQNGFPVLIIAPSGKAFMDLSYFAHNTKNRGGELIVISDQDKLLKLSHLSFKIPKSSEWISPIIAVIPGQLFARQLSLEKGLNPDRPEGITKVTETY